MTKEQLLLMAKRNLNQAKKALEHNVDRPGIKDFEIENLKNKIQYAEIVYNLIKTSYEEIKN